MPKNPDIWKGHKYIRWTSDMVNPAVRVPLADGSKESITVDARASEQETLEECIRLRDYLGKREWGAVKWRRMLETKTRSVPHENKSKPCGIPTGVTYEERGGSRSWMASWYEYDGQGKRKRRKVGHSFGGPYSRYATSEEALQAAIERREREVKRWYCVQNER